MNRSVVVVGAGIAGLSAAYRLQTLGFKVTVLEAGRAVGGRMAQRRSGPITYNTGARLIYPFGNDFHQLVGELGLRDALVPLNGLRASCRHPGGSYGLELMPGLFTLATPGLTFTDRLRLVASALRLLRLRRSVTADEAASAAAYDEETLSAYIRRTAGPRVLERLIEPVFRGTRSWNPESISAAFYASTVPHLIGSTTAYGLRGGMGQVCENLAGRLDVRLGSSAHSIRRTGNGTSGACRILLAGDRSEREIETDIVLCATEGSLLASLIPEPEEDELALFGAVRYNSLGALHYRLRGKLAPCLEFSARELPTRIATWQQKEVEDGSDACELYCQLTPEAATEAIRTGRTEALDSMVRDEIRERIPDFDARLEHHVNQWIPRKLPMFYPGYGRIVREFQNQQAAGRRNLYYCGDYLSQALVTGACHSGMSAATTIFSHWNS